MSQLTAAPEQPITVDEVAQRAKEKGTEVREQTTSRLQQEVGNRSRTAGAQLQTLSQSLRRTASELRTQGQQGQSEIMDQAAIRVEQLAGYLTESDPQQLVDDARAYSGQVVMFFRQQPLALGAAGVGVGLVATRLAGRLKSPQAA